MNAYERMVEGYPLPWTAEGAAGNIRSADPDCWLWVDGLGYLESPNENEVAAGIAQAVNGYAEAQRERDEAVQRLATSYVSQSVCAEMFTMLDGAGCGQPGTSNTLLGMVAEIIARAERAEKRVAAADHLAAALLAAERHFGSDNDGLARALDERAAAMDAFKAAYRPVPSEEG